MPRNKRRFARVDAKQIGTAKSAGRYVSIYCRGEALTPHEKWRLTSMRPEVHDDEVSWSEVEGGYAEADQSTLIPVSPKVSQWLDGDNFVPRGADGRAYTDGEASADVSYRDSFRVALMFRCPRCGLAWKLRRASSLFPVLSRISTPGVLEVSVRALMSVTKQ